MPELAILCLAIAVYAASCVPFLLLVDADFPTWRDLTTRVGRLVRRVPVAVAAALLILGGHHA